MIYETLNNHGVNNMSIPKVCEFIYIDKDGNKITKISIGGMLPMSLNDAREFCLSLYAQLCKSSFEKNHDDEEKKG